MEGNYTESCGRSEINEISKVLRKLTQVPWLADIDISIIFAMIEEQPLVLRSNRLYLGEMTND